MRCVPEPFASTEFLPSCLMGHSGLESPAQISLIILQLNEEEI